MTAWTHEHACSLPAPPEEVFSALTDPARLTRWFAEHVEAEPRVGGPFRFWGRTTYGAPSRSGAEQTIRTFEPPRRFSFGWSFHGLETEVSFELDANEDESGRGGTRLRLRHEFPAQLPVERPRQLVDDLWRLHLGNLHAHLLGDDGLALPDFTDPSPEVRVSIRIDAPRQRVFRALLDPAMLDRWIAESAVVEPKVGGRYSYGWNYEIGGRKVEGGPLRILELVENEKLVTDWPDWRGDESVPMQTITWLLEPEGEGTRVTIVHSGFVRAADVSDYPFGWPGFLGRLKRETESAATE